MNESPVSFGMKSEAEKYRNELVKDRPLCPLIRDQCDTLCRFFIYSRVITCGDDSYLVSDNKCLNPMFEEKQPGEGTDIDLGKYISKDEFLETLEAGFQNALWRLFTNGTSMPCADFFDSVKNGVKEAQIELGKG